MTTLTQLYRQFYGIIAALAMLACSISLNSCNSASISLLDQIRQSGELHVITRNSPSSYTNDQMGEMGFEFELTKQFANELGVELKITPYNGYQQALKSLNTSDTQHVAAIGLAVDEEAYPLIRFNTPYLDISHKVIFRQGTDRPLKPADLINKKVAVLANSNHAKLLAQLQAEYPKLQWQEPDNLETVDLLSLIEDGKIDYTIINSNEYKLKRAIFPHVRIGFTISRDHHLAWAFPRSEDNTLFKAATLFLQKAQDDGSLTQLKDRYYSHVDEVNYADAHLFKKHTRKRLPQYETLIKAAAIAQEIDWQLLAAIGYQESHWNPGAISPTGVRGIMMLTMTTAKEVGVKNRIDPKQSIMGGARYFSRIKKRIAENIEEPDRTWFALAAYNIGFGHLEDARAITRLQSANPDKWDDVKSRLPLLMQKKYYKFTRYGYARGNEAVTYVHNIRRYYEILTWTANVDTPENALTDVSFMSTTNPQAHSSL